MSSKKRASAKTQPQKRGSARERVAAARAAQKRQERMRWIITFAATGGVVVALGAGAAWAIVADNAEEQKQRQRPAADKGTGMPPWPLPADPLAGARSAGLDVAGVEGTAKHFHSHLDVLVNGKKVPVPANLGIDASSGQLAELHTHDDTGILHIEAPTTNKRYTLGQVFSEWNVRLSPAAIGGLNTNAANTLIAYVDGKAQSGDPAAIELTEHRQIALVYGPKNAKPQVPSSYDFPEGT